MILEIDIECMCFPLIFELKAINISEQESTDCKVTYMLYEII